MIKTVSQKPCSITDIAKNSPSFVAKCTLSFGKGRKEWGAEPGKEYYTLKIHEITERKGC